MTTQKLIKDLQAAMDLAEQLQNLEILEDASKKSTSRMLALAVIQNTIYEVKEQLERVQLAQ